MGHPGVVYWLDATRLKQKRLKFLKKSRPWPDNPLMQRSLFLFMAVAQVLFAVRCLRNPQAAKAVNIRLKTVWARLPLSFYRGVGIVCAGGAIWFLYLFFNPPK